MVVKENSGIFDVSKHVVPAILVLLLCTGTVLAQVTASMTGDVKDASGAVVPDATVTVKNLESGLTRVAQTDASGTFSLLSLPVGQYEITAEKAGFKQQIRRGITLVVGQKAVVNLTLEVGNVEQQVTVTAEAPLVNTTLDPTSGLVSETQVKDLPLNGRSFDQLLTLNVGTTNYTANSSHNAFSVAGRRPESNRFTINGMDYVGSDSSSQTVTPSSISGEVLGVDAVREFNVVQPPYSAEYGKRGGGQVTIVSSSGTNQLHGDAFEYLRNSALDARNYLDYKTIATGSNFRLPPLKRNQFGGSLGGPIKKDKLFLFGSYEGFRQRVGQSAANVVPDEQVRQGLIPNATTGVYAAPAGEKAGMLGFFKLWPDPNGAELLSATGVPTGLKYSFANPVDSIREDFGLARLDYNASSKDSASFTFVDDDGERNSPNATQQFLSRSNSINRLLSVQETRIFSPAILNVATLGYARAWTPSHTLALIPIDPSLEFIRGAGTGTITLGGVITGGGQTSIASAGSSTVPLTATRNLYSIADDLHYTRGSHNMTFGVWIQDAKQALTGAPAAQGGSVSYSTLTAMLTDSPNQFIAVPNPTALYYKTTEAAWYVQDDFKLKSNLSLRVGLRDEITSGWNEVHGKCPNFLFDSSGVINTDPFVASSCLTQNNSLSLWQPRVGVAWDPTGTGAWAVRAGFGIYNDLQDSLAHRLNSNPPFNSRVTFKTPILSFIPLPAAQPPTGCNAQVVAAGQPCSIFLVGGLDPEMHTPTIQQWNLTVERQLTKSIMLQLGYIGSQSYHLSTSIDANEAKPLVCQDAAGCPSGGINTTIATAIAKGQIVPQGTTYQPAVAAAPTTTNSNLPNPFVANTFSWWYNGVSSYNALTVSLVQRASHGLSFKAGYTFAKIMDLNSAISGSNGTNEPMTIYDRFNMALNKGVAAYSLKNQFNVSYTYELPFGSGKQFASGASGALDKVIGGWQWNGILQVQSGFPFTPQIGSNISGNGDTFNPDLPNVKPGFTGPVVLGIDGYKKTGRYFDRTAFVTPIPGTYGNVSRGSLIGPGLTEFDTSFFKGIKLTENWNLQFRMEAFNLFNHANFTKLNATIGNAGGTITEVAPARQLQLALRLNF
jgi:Carboxypeptidase regulatory-like domain